MTYSIRFGAVLVAVILGASPFAQPVPAQSTSSVDRDNIRRVIVYGTDPCPPSPPGEIVVCARRPDGDRYRIPERFRKPDSLTGEHEAWSQRAEQLEMHGASGIASCSPVGPGGASGCMQQLLQQAARERQEQTKEANEGP